MHLIGVINSWEVEELIKFRSLLSAASLAFSEMFVMSLQVSKQHCLLLKIKFYVSSYTTFIIF